MPTLGRQFRRGTEHRKANAHNLYKDRLRTIEIEARRRLNRLWAHPLNPEEMQAFFRKQLEDWSEARQRYEDLQKQRTRNWPSATIR